MLWEPGIARLPNNNFFSFSFFLFWRPPPLVLLLWRALTLLKRGKEMPGSLTSKSKALLGGISLGFHTMPRFSSSSSSVHCARELREREREREEKRACVLCSKILQQQGKKERKQRRKEGCVFFSPSLAMIIFCKEWSHKEEKVSSAHHHRTSASLWVMEPGTPFSAQQWRRFLAAVSATEKCLVISIITIVVVVVPCSTRSRCRRGSFKELENTCKQISLSLSVSLSLSLSISTGQKATQQGRGRVCGKKKKRKKKHWSAALLCLLMTLTIALSLSAV